MENCTIVSPLRQKPAMTPEVAEAKCPAGTWVVAGQCSHSCRVATALLLYGLLCGTVKECWEGGDEKSGNEHNS